MPYQAVVPLLYSLLELVDTTPPHLLRQQVRTQLAAISSSLATDEPLLSRLLGISLEPDVPPALPPEEQKRRLRNVCRQVIAYQALVQPFCLLVEDGQWLDSGSQELLDLLVAMLPRLPLLILVTARPGFHHLWEDSTSFHRLTLIPLRREHTDAIVFHWCWPYKASAALRALIHERTEGNPFFIEGMLRTLQDQQLLVLQDDTFVLRAGAALALPSSIHRVLAARIDRLAPDLKEVVQVGAVIGREFPLWLLEAVIGRTDLHSTLTTLSRLESIREKVSQPEPTYIFKHALTREVAYASVLNQVKK
jgi:predicted ATPase